MAPTISDNCIVHFDFSKYEKFSIVMKKSNSIRNVVSKNFPLHTIQSSKYNNGNSTIVSEIVIVCCMCVFVELKTSHTYQDNNAV